jgi:homoserine O-succinyltransferase
MMFPKKLLSQKLFGIFPHGVNERRTTLFRGFDDEFPAPRSRHTECDRDVVAARPEPTIESETPDAGIFIVTARDGREVYATGHLEYDSLTLDREYRRDLSRGLFIAILSSWLQYAAMPSGFFQIDLVQHDGGNPSGKWGNFVSDDTPPP